MKEAYPYRLKVGRYVVEELSGCEYGRYEDEMSARAEDPDHEHEITAVEILRRFDTVIRMNNREELREIWYSFASGTFGATERGYYLANACLDRMRDFALSEIPYTVAEWPRCIG